MKLDEWQFHKNRRKKVQPYNDFSKHAQRPLVYVPYKASPSPSKLSRLAANEPGLPSDTLDPPMKDSTMRGSLLPPPSSVYEAGPISENPSSISPLSTQLSQSPPTTVGWVTNDLNCPSLKIEDIIVNTSLKFFSFRPHTESLQLLAKSPEMALLAVEIVLRNWKPGGECMRYVLRFLENPAYCRRLLLYNSTRWTDEDETLFNLIDVEIPEDPQVLTALTKAVLKADLKFKHPLRKLRPTWADQWRLALRQTEWSLATKMVRLLITEPCEVQLPLVRLKRDRRLVYCALVVIAESLLERNKIILVSWRGDIDIFFETARSQYFEILKDCRLWGIVLDPAWYADLVVVNTIDHGTSCYFTSPPTSLEEQP